MTGGAARRPVERLNDYAQYKVLVDDLSSRQRKTPSIALLSLLSVTKPHVGTAPVANSASCVVHIADPLFLFFTTVTSCSSSRGFHHKVMLRSINGSAWHISKMTSSISIFIRRHVERRAACHTGPTGLLRAPLSLGKLLHSFSSLTLLRPSVLHPSDPFPLIIAGYEDAR
ncbi:hypothetical protein EYF80_042699 [Liparis tanakae]|uniref:Uncharacterized protein n=1 Tax=Liparis tanakae TaxID=230148 RepID=A0A4Z2G0P8_9TELE|nr:hypothetical protein EYF80_042699 [Liparis tanakae]